VPQGVDPDAGQEVQVAAALGVINVTTFTAGQHERVAGIVLKKVLLFQVFDRLGRNFQSRRRSG
jgi:hypothetical protein